MPAKKDESKIIAFGILRAIGILAALTLVLFILYKLSSVIVYLSVAAVVSLIFRPFNLFLRRRLKFNNTLAVTTSMVIIIFLIIGLFSLMVPLILKESENLSLLNTQELRPKWNL
jgi:predicted PurR-regulated permease PerM